MAIEQQSIEISQRGNRLHIFFQDLRGSRSEQQYIHIGLVDGSSESAIRLGYDWHRAGYVIEQLQPDVDHGVDFAYQWQEVAFIRIAE